MAAPGDLAEYVEWLRSEHAIIVDERTRAHFELVTRDIAESVSDSVAWRSIIEAMSEANHAYYARTGFPLVFGQPQKPEIVIKPFDSALEKSFRKNILLNTRWPEPPALGWITPLNWFSTMNDIIRTTVVVKYIDGVRFLAEALGNACNNVGLPNHVDMEARWEGYYAAHFYVDQEIAVADIQFDVHRQSVSLELQITTQLQEVIRLLLHENYEESRLVAPGGEDGWKWAYSSREFKVNYLGHILHYLEGLIADVRSRATE